MKQQTITGPVFITDHIILWMEKNTPIALDRMYGWLMSYDAELDDVVPTEFIQEWLTPREWRRLETEVITYVPTPDTKVLDITPPQWSWPPTIS